MRHYLYIFICLTILVSCNKDEEIVVEGPGEELPGDTIATDAYTVMEYLPAPGQFINEKASGFDGVVTMEEACRYAKRRLDNNEFVSLGAWGGYITFRFAEPIANTGGYDFSIAGNAFEKSSEPGIVWVMEDSNGNGLPDDRWYELRGSYYGQPGFETDYSVTYYRPGNARGAVKWKDSNGDEGKIEWLSYHSQDSYYPEWVAEDSYTLSGSRLPAQTERNSETGEWTNRPFKWGYADNYGEDSAMVQINGKTVQMNYFRITDAVDANGHSVNLSAVDFIKVQTAVNGMAEVIGENSTEVCGIWKFKK